MNLAEELRMVLDTLRAHRVRTFLTLLGIILGVGTLVALSSAIESSGRYMERGMQQASGEDIVSISSRHWGRDDLDRKAPPLSRFDSRALDEAPRLGDSLVLNRYSMRVPWGERWGQNIQAVGTMPQALQFYQLEIDRGRFIAEEDVRGRTAVAVLGARTVEKLLGGQADPLGKQIRLKGERFRVIGTMKPKPRMGEGGYWTWDNAVVIPETTFVDRLARSRDLREIALKTPPELLQSEGLGRLVATARAIVTWRHLGVQNFQITDPEENARSRMIVTLIVGGLEVAIAGVCLVVGGINLMNIMLVSVLQRTREIGIRRAIGATRGNIRRTFLVEAAILAGVGGLLGVAGGVGFAWVLSAVLQQVFGFWPFVFPVWQSAMGFAAALFTGVVFGWFPAHRAANLSPIDCLRYE